MECGLIVKYLYHDSDVLEVRVSAPNGRFAGSAAVYVDRHELRESARVIGSFPTTRSDVRALVWEPLVPNLREAQRDWFSSAFDAAQHAQVSIQIETADATQSALAVAGVEPAGIDNFIAQLRVIDEELRGRATLEFPR